MIHQLMYGWSASNVNICRLADYVVTTLKPLQLLCRYLFDKWMRLLQHVARNWPFALFSSAVCSAKQCWVSGQITLTPPVNRQ